jgi:hypothetical protein
LRALQVARAAALDGADSLRGPHEDEPPDLDAYCAAAAAARSA